MDAKSFILKNSTAILLGVSITGYIASMVTVARTSAILERRKEKIKELEKREQYRIYLKAYAPSAAIGILTISSMIGGHRIHIAQTTAALSMFRFVRDNFQDYKEGVTSISGEKKAKIINGEVSEKRMRKIQIPESVPGTGSVLCFDDLSGRFFFSEMEALRKAQNDFNEALINGDSIRPLNDFYYDIGLDSIKLGENIGWEVGKELVALEFDSKITASGKPCLIVRHKNIPELIW